jgi:group I intron endonuclease
VNGIIYLAINKTNGKVYIGQTTQTLKRRKAAHKYRSLKGDCRYAFGVALIEGFDNFTWEEIDSAESQEELDAKEKDWIAHYDSTNPDKGYNGTDGGTKTTYSLEVRRKMSEVHKGMPGSFNGKHHTEETRRKISETEKGRPSPMKGRHLSEETRRKMSEVRKGKRHSAETRRKLSEANIGKHPSAETRRKISETLKGHRVSVETWWKIGEAKRRMP